MRKAMVGWAAAAAATAMTMAPAQAAGPGPRAACATGDAASAAVSLYGTGSIVERTEQVAGLQTALALEPFIAPGTRHRMVLAGGRWCDAESGLNRAWRASGRSVGTGAALAKTYARLAAAPYFDGTKVTSIRSVGGVHTVRTHARTNGIVALWTIVTDASGVRTASWKSTDFAVKPFEAQIEGLTGITGASERYTRVAGGTLKAARGLPTSEWLRGGAKGAEEAPSVTSNYTTPDGYSIQISTSEARGVAPDLGMDTGVAQADRIRLTAEAIKVNYEDFYGWGFRAAWPAPKTRVVLVNSPVNIPAGDKVGYVYLYDGTSAFCQACVFIADDFQIHLITEVGPFLAALGYTYPDERKAFIDVVGHEMFHNWQNNYVKPSTGRNTLGSYSEGTARFQETIHGYSEVSHQPGSLVYANDVNGCNGFNAANPASTMAAGPFTAQSYAACHFWLPFYGEYGLPAFAELVMTGVPAGATPPEDGDALSAQGELIEGVRLATGKPFLESLGAWARGTITGRKLAFGPAIGPGPVLDWAKHLERWNPAPIEGGQSESRTLANGGILARQLTEAGTVSVTGDDTRLIVLRVSPTDETLTYPASGTAVAAPAAGEKVYVLAARPTQGTGSATLTVE